MKKLNICIIGDTQYQSLGGVGVVTKRFSSQLKKRGHNVIIVTTKRKNEKKFEILDGIKIYRVFSFKVPFIKGYYYQAMPTYSELKKIFEKEKIQVIFLVSFTHLGLRSQETAENIKLPVVYGLYVQPENFTQPINLNYGFFNFIIGQWLRVFCDRSCEIITTTKFSKKIARKYGIKKKIHTISCGIDLSEFNPRKISDGAFRKKFKLQDMKYFLTVGRLMKEKNIPLIIKAAELIDWQKHKNLKIVIVGDGPDKEQLKKMAKDLDVDKHIIFTGKISDEMLKSAYKGCLTLLHASFIELEGLIVLEAMAFGKPLLIADSKKSASPMFVKKNKNGFLFNPKDPEELAKKMMILAGNKRLLAKFSNQSLKKISKYSVKKSIEKLEKVFLRNIKKTKNKKKNINN